MSVVNYPIIIYVLIVEIECSMSNRICHVSYKTSLVAMKSRVMKPLSCLFNRILSIFILHFYLDCSKFPLSTTATTTTTTTTTSTATKSVLPARTKPG